MNMNTIPETHRDLLNTNIAMLATIGASGYPQVTAIWFLYDENSLKLSLTNMRQKVKNLQKHPECTLFIIDPANPLRTLEIRARAVIQPDTNYAFADKLGRKYGGADMRQMDRPGEQRLAVTLEPVKVIATDLSGG